MDGRRLKYYQGLIRFILVFQFIASFLPIETKAQNPSEPLYFWQDTFLFKSNIDECSLDTVCAFNLRNYNISTYFEGDIAFDNLGNLFFISSPGKLFKVDTINGLLDSVYQFDADLQSGEGTFSLFRAY